MWHSKPSSTQRLFGSAAVIMQRLPRLVIAIAVMMVALGCEPPLGYQLRVRNAAQQDINSVRVSYGDFLFDQPTMKAGIEATYHDVQEPLPTEAIVEWRYSDGASHREVVNVMPRSAFRGVLVIEIDGDNGVNVRTEAPPRH